MNPKVLIVDDINDNIFLMEITLEDLPISTDSATSGEEAISLAQKNEYVAILMDINMPGMDGFECIRRIREIPGHQLTPVIFITAAGNMDDYVERGYAVGAIDYLNKPIEERVICSKVSILISLFTERKNSEEALRKVQQLQRQHEQLLNFTADGIVGLDTENIVTFANTAACTLLTATLKSIIGQPFKNFIDPLLDEQQWEQSDFVQTFKEGQCNQSDNTFFWRNQQAKFPVQYTQSSIVEDDIFQGGVVIFQDISERKEIENQLVNLAKFDQLTGLSNRTLYWEFLEKVTAYSKRTNDNLCVMFIDLDHFKEINDSLGHDAGDLLLVQATERLKSVLRNADLISRLGGDEFAVVIQQLTNINDIATVAQKIIDVIAEPFFLFDKESYIGASIGIASFPEHGMDATTLTKAADTAMYHAKQHGRNTYKFFDNDMHMRIQSHLEVSNDLRIAIKQQDLEPYYQPIIKISDQKLNGFEALVRWNHKEKGLVSPGLFIPVAEESGLIEDIGNLMLLLAGKQANDWFCNETDMTIAINVAAKQLKQKDFSQQILRLLDNQHISPHYIKLELTESALMDDPNDVIRQLHELRDVGITIAIDDFGTGYSSLSYLKKFPIDFLKIDQSFVREIGEDKNDEAIINAIIQMAHSLGLKVIAEGVETKEQLGFLKNLDCDYAQGYLFSKPVPWREAEQFLPMR
ncbi:hypothetical protein A9Q99_16465 [Gammaproteobacteria bacterium 45_16_T64]|nr:hypothetical protein A9Q99_16465 [Gammaproteobacteria bacterium 45_16_T64]